MSRSISDSDLLALADKLDCWMPSWRTPPFKVTLRNMIEEAVAFDDGARAFLFRAGGFGEPAIWLEADDITRLARLMNVIAHAA